MGRGVKERSADGPKRGDDHGGPYVTLPVQRDEPPHQVQEIPGEQGVHGGVLHPIGAALHHGHVGESGPSELLGEVTLRQGACHSPGPGRRVRQDFVGEILLVHG